MGNGVAVPSKDSRQTASADHEHPATNSQNIAGLARLAEAKSKFMNTKEKREALKASKQVSTLIFIVNFIFQIFLMYILNILIAVFSILIFVAK